MDRTSDVITLNKFNNTESKYPSDKTLVRLFEDQVLETPLDTAVVFDNNKLSYLELNEKANRLANLLVKRGVTRDCIVGIFLNRSVEIIIAQLAVLKAGGAYLPVDVKYPEDRIRFMLDDSNAVTLISEESLIESSGYDGSYIDIYAEDFRRWSKANLSENIGFNDLACVIYTSGSTGKPKGVMLEHKNLVNFSWWYKKKRDLKAGENIALHSSFSFDAAIMGTYPVLFSGATIHILPEEIRLSLVDIDRYFTENEIRGCFFTTQLTEQYMESYDNPCLRFIEGGGEKFKKYVKRSYKIINGYGPTESTVYVTDFEVDKQYGNIPIGKPLSNVKIYMVDQEMNLCPVGVSGELCISGANLGRGYLNRPELTAEKFLKNPFASDEEKKGDYGRLYKTGDLAQWLPDGNIEILGRIDFQVKIRGFRVELGEIESKLVDIYGIYNAVVVALDDIHGGKFLCGYYVAEKELKNEAINKELSKVLPDYMVPSFYIRMQKFPLTPNGKVDRKALPKPDLTNFLSENYIAPKTAKEKKIAKYWSEVLGIDKPGIKDNFFDSGGTSINAVLLVTMLQKEFDINISNIFDNPTIEQLSKNISTKKYRLLEVRKVRDKNYYSASGSQKSMYMTNEIADLGVSYNIPFVMNITGDLDVDKLNIAVNRMLERHEILRTCFELRDGDVTQTVNPCFQLKLEKPVTVKENELDDAIMSSIQPFNLEETPLFRIKLFCLSKGRHILLFDIHHIIFDGASVDIFVKELFDFYYVREPAPLKLQYRDYAEWEDSYKKTSEYSAKGRYWEDKFKGESVPLELPLDYLRKNEWDNHGDTVNVNISENLRNSLNGLRNMQGITLYMVMLAAYNILLSKYTRQEDVIVGVTSSGRFKEEISKDIGMFVNTLPLRTCPDSEKTFRDYLFEVKNEVLGLLENQGYQLQDLVDALHVKTEPGRNPVFDVLFNYVGYENVYDFGDIKLDVSEYRAKTAKFDLMLDVRNYSTNLSVILEYRKSLFRKQTIERVGLHYTKVLETIVRTPDIKLKDISLITLQEESEILGEFNNTVKSYQGADNIVDLFEQVVVKYPDNVAVSYKNKELSYKDLSARSNRLGSFLREKGIKNSDIVGFLFDSQIEMIESIFGILKAGAAYMPIAPEYPEDRVTYMLKDSNAKLLITSRAFVSDEKKMHYPVEIFYLEDFDWRYNSLTNYQDLNIGLNDLAYIIYTSGSTGKPKGVMIENKSLVNFCGWYRERYELSPEDKVSKIAGVAFDVSVMEIFPTLLSGAGLCLVPGELKLDLLRLNTFFIENKITLAYLPTQLGEYFMDLENTSLKTVILAGDKLKRYISRSYKLYNGYGPTEATVLASDFPVTELSNNIPIGKPLSNYKMYITGKNMELCPIGVPGELCISGVGLARGYLNKPELTAEKFIENPFVTEKEKASGYDRLYKTGDLARWMPDGNIEFLGRIDFQVKIRGFRIELGEIENKILEFPGIKDVVVLALDDNAGNKYLCGYYVADKEVDTDKLKKKLLEKLPEYMVPTFILRLEKFPLNPSGKVDRKALPKPDLAKLTAHTYVAPRDIKESAIAEIYADVLGMNEVGVTDSFFDLGGSSLKAVKLVSKLQPYFEVTIRDIFACPDIESLARKITERKSRFLRIRPVEKKDYYLASGSQKGMFLTDQMGSLGSTYNIPMIIEIDGDLNREKLGLAINDLVERHEAFRTSFAIRDGEVVQIIHDKVDFKKEYMTSIKNEELSGTINDFIKPFDLTEAPLFRVKLLKLGRNKNILLFDIHHIIFDGGSVEPFVKDLFDLYAGDKPASLEIQYKDYAEWEVAYRQSEEYKTKGKYWLDRLSGSLPVLDLPTDYPRKRKWDYNGALLGFKFPDDLSGEIGELRKTLQVTNYTFMLAAYNILLAKYSRQEEIIVGAAGSGRSRREIQKTIGIFVNMLPLRSCLEGDKTFKEYLFGLKETVLSLLANQEYQFQDLVEGLNIIPEVGRNPIFDIGFNYLIDEGVDFADFNIKVSHPEIQTSKFDLTLSISEKNGNLEGNLEYRTSLFNRATINRLKEHYLNILREVLANPDIKLKDISLITANEKSEIVNVFNNTSTPYSKNKTFVEIFEETVYKYPENIALVYGGKQLSYRELDRKTNRLARTLALKGIGAGDIAGVLFGPSLEMIISIIGVLKTGAAYLPMASDYPEDRRIFMLQDSRAKVLLTAENLVSKDDREKYETDVLFLDDENSYDVSDEKLGFKPVPKDLAYVIYTSGSTGKPKGVMIEHHSLVNFTEWAIKEYKVTPNDKGSKYAGFGFDASVTEIYPILLSGGTLHVIPKELKLDVLKLEKYFRENEITYSFLPTQFAELFMDYTDTKLRLVIAAGDKLKKYDNPPYKLANGYGPTETTVGATNFFVDKYYNNIPIGRPVYNTKIYIVDAQMNICPVGIPGELCISGVGVARGYLNRQELTAEKFTANPFATEEDKVSGYDRLYKTGDLARWLPDGNIEFLGRIDFQVKIRGFRIEPGEIENRILEFPGIKDVLVAALEDESGNKYLCCYYVANEELNAEKMKEDLLKSLPDYMVPAFNVWVKEFPLTASGKVNRKALPEPDLANALTETYVAPRNPKEEKLTEIWADVLGLEKVGIKDNFFKLGGSSIKAVTLVAKLQVYFPVTITDIFNYPEIEELVKHLDYSSYELREKFEQIKTSIEKQIALADNEKISELLADYKKKYDEKNRRYKQIDLNRQRPIKSVLLTGATGYLGIHVLKELIEAGGKYFIYCIIRGVNDDAARERLLEKSDFYFGKKFSECMVGRLKVLNGDLAEQNLGLSEKVYQDLASRVDSIIHTAANVGHYGDYKTFYKANVVPVINLVEFAERGIKKDLHYVSTRSVCDMINIPGTDYFITGDYDDVSDKPVADNVYVKTKLEGEKVALEARTKGLNTSIYRVGNLVFNSETGKHQQNVEDNAFYQTLKTYLNLGLIPSTIDEVEMSYVDYTAKGICLLFDKENLQNEIFHLYTPFQDRLSDLFSHDELNLRLDVVDVDTFIDFLYKKYDKKFYKKYIENLMLHMGWMEESVKKTVVVTLQDKTNMILKELGFEWKPVNPSALTKTIIEIFKERVELIGNTPLFKNIDKNTIAGISGLFKLLEVSKDTKLLKEGTAGDKIYIIVDGVLAETKKSYGGWEGTLRVVGGKNVLGLDSVLFDMDNSTTMEVILKDAYCFEIAGNDFIAILNDTPLMFKNILFNEINEKDKLKRMIVALK